MANKIISQLAGMGSVDTVTNACSQQLREFPNQLKLFGDFAGDLECLLSMDNTRRLVLALLAAHFNSKIEESGYSWNVDGFGRLDRTYHASEHDRKLIASTLAD